MQPSDLRPIGVFDSGIGGLTILRELVRTLPHERFIYFGDDAHCPYGPRPEAEVIDLSLAAARWLVRRDAKAIVVACNTASVSARVALRAAHPTIPFVVVVPAVKPAAALTRTHTIILAATARAINDRYTHALIESFTAGVRVIPVACPRLVELVEDGRLTGPEPEAALAAYLRPALDAGADVVVLGCTHFPALRGAVEAVVGPTVRVIDSGAAVAQQTLRVLTEHGLQSGPTPDPFAQLADGEGSAFHAPASEAERMQFWTSGEPERFARVASLVLGQQVSARYAG